MSAGKMRLEDSLEQAATRELAARLGSMRSAVVPVEEPEVLAARRGRLVGKIHDSLTRVPAARRFNARLRIARRVGFSLAALVALGFGYRFSVQRADSEPVEAIAAQTLVQLRPIAGTVVLYQQGQASVVSPQGATFGAGGKISTGVGSRAELQLSEQAQISVSASTELTLKSARLLDEELELSAGHVEVDVPHPDGRERRLIVRTPNGDVSVKGTHFSVDVAKGASGNETVTSVEVSRGVVLVTQGEAARALLGTGERWSSLPSALPATAADTKPTRSANEAQLASEAVPTKEASTSGAAVARAGGTLAKENGLFRAALAARNQGDDDKALTLLDQFLARYPRSTLTQEVRVERFRALRRLGRQREATQSAREYLARHASGFAREEARELVLEPDGRR